MQQKIFIGFLLTLIIVIFIPIYWVTESARQEAALERLKAEPVGRGARLYAANCAACHGTGGEGGVGPALKNSPLNEDALVKITSKGVPGTAMSAWGKEDGGPLRKSEIEDLVTFIKNWDSTKLK